MKPGWTAEVTVDADLHKVPTDPVEAAKYAMDEVRRLATPFVTVEHHDPDGLTHTWMVDTADGSVAEIGTSTSDMDDDQREDYYAEQAKSPCAWVAREHAVHVWRLRFSADPDDWTLACSTHLGDLMNEDGASVAPFDNNEGSTD